MSNVSLRYVGDVVIVDVRGRLGADSAALKDCIRGLMLDGCTNIVLSLRRVRGINSDGLRALFACRAAAARLGARVLVTHLTARLSDLVVIAAIATAFDVYVSEHDALRDLRGQVTSPAEETRATIHAGSVGVVPVSH